MGNQQVKSLAPGLRTSQWQSQAGNSISHMPKCMVLTSIFLWESMLEAGMLNLWTHLSQVTCVAFSVLNWSKGELKRTRAWVHPWESWERGMMAMTGDQWHLLINLVTSCFRSPSWNKPCDSLAGFLPVLSPSRSCAFLSVDLSSYFSLHRRECTLTLSLSLSREAIITATFSWKPQWIGMDNLFISEPKSSKLSYIQKRQIEDYFEEFVKIPYSGQYVLMIMLICEIPVVSDPIVLGFIFTGQILFYLKDTWNGFKLSSRMQETLSICMGRIWCQTA